MLKIKDGFVMRNICDEWIIVPVEHREEEHTFIMTVNETGHFLWEMLEKGTTEQELLLRIREEYEVDEQTAQKDIVEFVQQLRNKAII